MLKFLSLFFIAGALVAVNAQEIDECPDISCDLVCPFGLKTDSDECEICECKPCPDVICALFCENGYKLNANGTCPICECEEEEEKCETLNCDVDCPFGYKTGLDGCRTCDCVENPCQCKANETCVINEKLEWDCEAIPGENEECDIDDDDDDRETSGSKSASTGSKSTGSKSTGSKSHSITNCTHNSTHDSTKTKTKCHHSNYTRNYTHSSSRSGSDSTGSNGGNGRASIPERVLERLSSNSQREEEREEQDRIRENNNGAASRNFFRNLKTKSDSCREGYFCKQSSADSDGVCSAIPNDGPCITSSDNPDVECDRNGYYRIKLCTENDDGDTECVCVEPVNGTKLEETRKVVNSVRELKRFNCIDAVYGTCLVRSSNGRPYLVKHGREHFDRGNCRRCRCYYGDLYCDDALTVCAALGDGPSSCTLDDGTTIEHGNSYTDDCNTCFCRNGKVICSPFACSAAATSMECSECSSEKVKKVCGPNGVTYDNLCEAKCAGFDENVILNGTCTSNQPCKVFPCESGEICLRQGGVSCLAQGGCMPDEVRVCFALQSFQCDFGSLVTSPTTATEPTDVTTPTEDGLIGSGDVDPSDTAICGTNGRSYPAICHVIPNHASVQVAHAGRCDDVNCRGGKVCGTDGVSYDNICVLRTISANARLDYPGECIDSDDVTSEEYCQSVMNQGLCQHTSDNCDNLVQPVVGCCPICGSSITLIVDRDELQVAASIVSSMSTLDNLMGSFLSSGIFTDLAGRCKPVEASLTPSGNIELIITHVTPDDEEFCVSKANEIITRINSVTSQSRKRQEDDGDNQLSSGFQIVLGAAIAPEVDDDGGSDSGVAQTSMAFTLLSLLVTITALFTTYVL